MGESDSGKAQMDLEKAGQTETDLEKNPVYAEVYESKNSRRSSQNSLHHAYTNDVNVSDVVMEEEFPREQQSPPAGAVDASPLPALTTAPSNVSKSKQTKAGKKYKTALHTNEKMIIDFENRDRENLQESIKVSRKPI